MIAAGFVAILALVPSLARTAPNPARPDYLSHAATYSDLCLDRETSDVMGLRIFVRWQGRRPQVFGQYAEGELPPVEAARTEVAHGRLQFTLAGDVPETTFSGEIFQRYALVRSHESGARTFRLPLRNDAHGLPFCR